VYIKGTRQKDMMEDASNEFLPFEGWAIPFLLWSSSNAERAAPSATTLSPFHSPFLTFSLSLSLSHMPLHFKIIKRKHNLKKEN